MSDALKEGREPLDRGIAIIETLVANHELREEFPGVWKERCDGLANILVDCHVTIGLALLYLLTRYGKIPAYHVVDKGDERWRKISLKYRDLLRQTT